MEFHNELNFNRIALVWYAIFMSAFIVCVSCEYVSEPGLLNPLAAPSAVDAMIGETVFLKITNPVKEQTHCMYRITGGTDVDVALPHKKNIEAWTNETCGLQIKNITMEDSGFWRLTSISTAQNDKNVARGLAYINVQNNKIKETPETIIVIKSPEVDITPEQTSYCYVLRPDQMKNDFPQHSTCKFPKFDNFADANGIWQIVAGLKGKTAELTFQVDVQSTIVGESVQTSVEHSAATSTLNMKCKLMKSNRVVSFCRFVRLNDDVGYNLEAGRGEGRYRYNGDGFAHQECGISITNPDDNDKSPWKCLIGVENNETMGAIVDGSDPKQPYGQDDIETSDLHGGLVDTNVNILCRRNTPTDYCWFKDDNGQKILLSDKQAPKPTDKYKYYGAGINLGECGITIVNATQNLSGTWSCHMGTARTGAVDAFKEFGVRITETSFISTELNHHAQQSTSLLLECRSIPDLVPLDYCRFVLPDGITGFSINEQTTADKPYDNNYYFNPNRKIKSGYCSIIVKKIDRAYHHGRWMCAAALTGSTHESSDEFQVNVFGSDNDHDEAIAVAGVTGMMMVIIFVAGALIFVIYKRYRQNYSIQSAQRRLTDLSNNSSGVELSVIEGSVRCESEISRTQHSSTNL